MFFFFNNRKNVINLNQISYVTLAQDKGVYSTLERALVFLQDQSCQVVERQDDVERLLAIMTLHEADAQEV